MQCPDCCRRCHSNCRRRRLAFLTAGLQVLIYLEQWCSIWGRWDGENLPLHFMAVPLPRVLCARSPAPHFTAVPLPPHWEQVLLDFDFRKSSARLAAACQASPQTRPEVRPF